KKLIHTVTITQIVSFLWLATHRTGLLLRMLSGTTFSHIQRKNSRYIPAPLRLQAQQFDFDF
ncbi:hypothetical protein, partial [Neisseria blantyrii]|uniref:hypothetical protein n=1 Tax=Neisseria blantyrii TaxID=2830647 RepID=UPI00272C987F